ncbi:MAG: DUF2141 domain-containing protein [Treponema sp.]|nr:DUF2141 domain-containing protein [Treponema sp.]
MKKLFLISLIVFLCEFLAAENFNVKLAISEIRNLEGKLYVDVINSRENFKNRISHKRIELNPTAETVDFSLELPAGEYVFSLYQDVNCNKKLDANVLGIPKEPYGFSNYDGKSIPNSFEKLKVAINKNETVLIKIVHGFVSK